MVKFLTELRRRILLQMIDINPRNPGSWLSWWRECNRFTEDTQISSEHQRSSNDNLSAVLEKFHSSLEAIDKRF